MTINKKMFFCLLSFIFIVAACIKKDNIAAEEKPKGITERTDNVLVNERHKKGKNELIELIKKTPYPNAPSQFFLTILRRSESFLELEKHSNELLEYALELFQDKTLTSREQWIAGYALLSADFEKYKYFLRDVAILFIDGRMDDLIVGFLFFPGEPDVNGARNLQDPIIREALEIYIKSNEVSAALRASIIDDLKRTAPN